MAAEVDPAACRRQRRGRLALLGLFAVFFVPLLVALVLNITAPGWQPFGRVNRGQLVQPPQPVAAMGVRALDGAPFGVDGEAVWQLAYAGPPTCAEACASALQKMRQARLALGKDAGRVARWWLMTAMPDARTVSQARSEHPGVRLAVANPGAAAISGEPGSIMLVDPGALVVLRYAPDASASAILKDLKRLLRISTQG